MIGLGKQNMEDHIPAVMESACLSLDSVVDSDEGKLNDVALNTGVDGFTSAEDMLKLKKPHLAVVAVPHNQYFSLIKRLAEGGVHILKEKPLAINMDEALAIDNIINQSRIKMMVTLQRRFNPIFSIFEQLRSRIGKIYSLEGRYTMNVSNLDSCWRASKEAAGGGALIDMGYHYIDLLLWYFGLPKSVTARMSTGNREGQVYDVEDTVNLLFDYGPHTDHHGVNEKTVGNFLISRVYPYKEEKLSVFGRKGIIEIERGRIRRLDLNGEEIENLSRIGKWPSAAVEQVEHFARIVQGDNQVKHFSHKDHFGHVAVIDAAYQSDKDGNSASPRKILKNYNIIYE